MPADAIAGRRTVEPQGAWMSFRKDNRNYEAWLSTQCDVVKKDIREKHHQMKKSAFIFLRATYFRWAKKIPALCPELMDAPQLLSVGDLHLENFGTWRDADGRLVWGVNDFDEAATMPYPLDLVRLAASIRLADLPVSNHAATAALLRGYQEGLAQPQPALLDEGETWLRPYAADTEEKSRKFWKKVDGYSKAKLPHEIACPLIASLPKHAENIRFASRVAGVGSLGRRRFVAVAIWRGGRVLREAKALVPSAWIWAHGGESGSSHFLALANGKYRAPDPFLEVNGKFIFRRIAADSRKIELVDARGSIRVNVLQAMGFDLGSIHAAGSAVVPLLRADLKKRPRGWLNAAAKTAVAAVKRDHEEWQG
jgi:Uncharacterized protein conserved in bacteria (DUF2252)